MRHLILMALLCSTSGVLAETDQREHGAHQHGHAELKLAWSNGELAIELDSPAMNLTGFEHPAVDEKDKQILDHVLQQLKHANQLISPDVAADCKLKQVSIESSLIDHPPHGSDVDINEHEADPDHSPSDHADFEVSIQYHCESPDQLNHIETSGLFKAFNGLEELDVEWISELKQGAAELNPSNTRIKLR